MCGDDGHSSCFTPQSSHPQSLSLATVTPLALTAAAAAVLAVLGRLGAAATLSCFLVVSGQQSFDLRGDLPLIHG